MGVSTFTDGYLSQALKRRKPFVSREIGLDALIETDKVLPDNKKTWESSGSGAGAMRLAIAVPTPRQRV
jgi:hypothetical protein